MSLVKKIGISCLSLTILGSSISSISTFAATNDYNHSQQSSTVNNVQQTTIIKSTPVYFNTSGEITTFTVPGPDGGSDGFNQQISNRTVNYNLNERNLLLSLYSSAFSPIVGIAVSILTYLNNKSPWDYAYKTLWYSKTQDRYKVNTYLYRNNTLSAASRSKIITSGELGTWYYP